MRLALVLAELQRIAPLEYAEPWDNVGLLIGDPAQDVTKALVCIDYTAAVAAEAIEKEIGLVIAYHPPLFEPIKRLTADGPSGNVFEAARRGIAIYSPHTALDVTDGGTNDVLADAVGLIDRRPLKPWVRRAANDKLVTFVPAEAVEKVAAALFNAGAGRIGDYTSCSFRSAGQGTFFGGESTRPAIGEAGRLESVDEIRLETVVPIARVDAVVAALKQSHPYETPAFDLIQLAAEPNGKGVGRVGKVAGDRAAIIECVKESLGLRHVLVAGPANGIATTAAVCAGSGGSLLDDALAAGVDVFVTGELKHHDALRAAERGLTVVCTLHTNSERAALTPYAQRIAKACADLKVTVSLADRDPFAIA